MYAGQHHGDGFWHFGGLPEAAAALTPSYSTGLVVLSVLTSVLASYAALAVVDRVAASGSRPTRALWLAAGGTAMGLGIWAMHFIAMLAFSLPVAVRYSPGITLLSVVPAVAGSTVALLVMARESIGRLRLHVSGLLMAVGIGTMHYSGMEAMELNASMYYRPGLFVLSIVVAYAVATVALHGRFLLRAGTGHARAKHLTSAVILGLAAATMHYTAMQAAVFVPAVSPVSIESGLPSGLLAAIVSLGVGVILAITVVGTLVDRRLAEAAASLADTTSLHSAVLETMTDGVVTFAPDGTVHSVNRAFEQMFGYAVADLVGRPMQTMFPAFASEASELSAEPGRQVGTTVACQGRHADGSIVPVELVLSHVDLQQRRLFSAVVRDVASRMAAERAAAEHLAALEDAHEQLAAQAADLAEARDRAEAAAAAKSEFLAAMSHEIRTPMNGVLGMAQLLLDSPMTADQADQLRTLHSSGQALLTIINDILDFSKIDAGKLQIEPIPFDAHSTVAEVAELLAGAADQKGIELILRFAPRAPRHVVGDQGRIRQILLNLTSNAIKFTERGHVLIEVDGREAEDRATLEIRVHDTGIGIDEAAQSRLFQSFTQADVSTTRRYGGTGLGLAISRRLMDLMGGTIGVSSRAGHGSTFWIALPLPLAPHPVQAPVTVSLAGARALIVDDNDVNRRVLAEQFTRWGLQVDALASPEEALRHLRDAAVLASPCQVAVLDYCMPEMNGLDLGRALLADPAIPRPGLVLLTSAGQRGGATEAAAIGFAAYLTKPASPDALRRALELALGHSAAKPARVRAAENPRSASGRRVLVAEDNSVNQKVAVRMLERLGCRVDVAANGAEAVALWRKLPYDIVFMDCHMPEMDGLAACRAIRLEESEGQHIPIVALTANALAEDRDRCLEAGMDDYIAKPVRIEDLAAALERSAATGGTTRGPLGPFVPDTLLRRAVD